MFVSEELVLDLGFGVAEARLVNLSHDGWLATASERAYDEGLAALSLVRVGPFGEMPGIPKLVEARFLDVVSRDESARLALRWEATGHTGGLFPALDADITLVPAGEQATRVTLAGAYRPPLARLGAGIDQVALKHAASATIRSLLQRVGDALLYPHQAADSASKPVVLNLATWTARPEPARVPGPPQRDGPGTRAPRRGA
jgi:hypothetical protein